MRFSALINTRWNKNLKSKIFNQLLSMRHYCISSKAETLWNLKTSKNFGLIPIFCLLKSFNFVDFTDLGGKSV